MRPVRQQAARVLGKFKDRPESPLPKKPSRAFASFTRNPRSDDRGTKRPTPSPTAVGEAQNQKPPGCRPQSPTTRLARANGARGDRGGMSAFRVSVEWGLKDIKTIFGHLDCRRKQKVREGPVGKLFLLSCILWNICP